MEDCIEEIFLKEQCCHCKILTCPVMTVYGKYKFCIPCVEKIMEWDKESSKRN